MQIATLPSIYHRDKQVIFFARRTGHRFKSYSRRREIKLLSVSIANTISLISIWNQLFHHVFLVKYAAFDLKPNILPVTKEMKNSRVIIFGEFNLDGPCDFPLSQLLKSKKATYVITFLRALYKNS